MVEVITPAIEMGKSSPNIDDALGRLAEGILARQEWLRVPRIDEAHPNGMTAVEAALVAMDDLHELLLAQHRLLSQLTAERDTLQAQRDQWRLLAERQTP